MIIVVDTAFKCGKRQQVSNSLSVTCLEYLKVHYDYSNLKRKKFENFLLYESFQDNK